jgi:hypothetical protein
MITKSEAARLRRMIENYTARCVDYSWKSSSMQPLRKVFGES